ncbi:LEA type 2 family protein [Dehalococcoidia bacterium]|nr:LEA type 2 family protein [Dehalococcoidia bacterium]
MSKRILISSLMVTLLLVSITGYGCPLPQIPKPQVPEFRGITHQWGEVTAETAEIITTITVYNPNPFILPVKSLQTELFMAGIRLAQGKAEGLEMKTEGEFPLSISTMIQLEKIPEMWVEHIGQGEVSEMRLEAGVVFDLIIMEFALPVPPIERTFTTDLLGSLEGILKQAEAIEIAPFPENVPFKMVIGAINANWGEVSKERTELRLATQVYNDSDFPVTVSGTLVEASLNEMPLGDGRLAEEYEFSPNSHTEMEIILSLDNELLVGEFMPRAENGEKSVFSMKASFVLDLPPEIVAATGKKSVEVLAYEVSGGFETGLLRGMLGGT